MDRKRRRQESKVNSIIAEDINMQQIYKKYIGQFPKLKKLRDYFFDFHDFDEKHSAPVHDDWFLRYL